MRHTLLLLWLLLLAGCSGDDQPVTIGGNTMGTTWSLKIKAASSRSMDATAVQTELQQQLDIWEAILSHWRSDSAVSRFNASQSTGWTDVPAELVEVVEAARGIAEETDGALDITLAPLIEVWGFGSTGRRTHAPDEDAVTTALTQCGWQHLQSRRSPPALRKTRPGLQINVSAVAEGWALDHLAAMLDARGWQDYLLEIGGEILARGCWRAGIQAPEAPPGEIAQVLELENQALATSGVYRQRFTAGNREFPHVIDPRTGHPVAHLLLSVSVVHPEAVRADGYATALLVLGPDAGRKRAQELGIRAVWLERSR